MDQRDLWLQFKDGLPALITLGVQVQIHSRWFRFSQKTQSLHTLKSLNYRGKRGFTPDRGLSLWRLECCQHTLTFRHIQSIFSWIWQPNLNQLQNKPVNTKLLYGMCESRRTCQVHSLTRNDGLKVFDSTIARIWNQRGPVWQSRPRSDCEVAPQPMTHIQNNTLFFPPPNSWIFKRMSRRQTRIQ